MRNLWQLPMTILCIGILAACSPIQGVGSGHAVPATPSPSPGESMVTTTSPDTPEPTVDLTGQQPTTEETETADETVSQMPTATPEPSGTPMPAASGFEATVSNGLNARWQGRQAIVVLAEGEDFSDASLWLYERDGVGWKVAGGPWPAQVGKNGVSKQREGDGRAPSGVFLLGSAFGWAKKPEGVTYQYRLLDSRDRWVDDISSPFYNRWVRGSEAKCGSGEDLKKIAQYEHALVVHYNDEAEPGKGSAIFLHVWRGPGKPTHGCTAVSERHMEVLLRWLDYSARPVLLQGTEEQIKGLMAGDWGIACLPQGWGYADDFIPDAQLEIRYFTDNNFTGKRLSEYYAPQAVMRLEAIEALALAAADWRGESLGIRVYDAYRPQQATDAMIAWAEDLSETSTKDEYYPDLDKEDIPGQYVARQSNHRLGGTVDLTLLGWGIGRNLDMGGAFDFFGERSGYRFKGLASAQANNRAKLRATLTKYGFKPYEKEWWHFTYPVQGAGGDFPILPRERVLH